ncbi:MAG: hypothetical protein PHF14_09970 [Verrucomicrobiota bacterium]|nr:hypothetical protein [Verrucomicrobiota bacterium]
MLIQGRESDFDSDFDFDFGRIGRIGRIGNPVLVLVLAASSCT